MAIEELSIGAFHATLRRAEVTAQAVTQRYLDRIAALDASGPALNSVVTLNPKALDEAAALDAAAAREGALAGPLHGVPILLKDQIETAGVPTAFGSSVFADYLPERDATIVSRLRAAGAVVLGKTAMPDFATSWFAYSSRSGPTKNPYALDRDPGGSSSGTAAATAANLCLVGIGEDTGGSIRLPASFCNLVGVRVTPGLISRAGLSPLLAFQDTAGPMTRTVEDAARVLDALVGYDPADPWTASAHAAAPVRFQSALRPGALKGAVLGLVRDAYGEVADPDAAPVIDAVERAARDLEAAGARVVEARLPDFGEWIERTSLYALRSRSDIDRFLAARPALARHRVADIVASGRYDKTLDLLEIIATGPEDPETEPEYFRRLVARDAFQRMVLGAMAAAGADALIYPTARRQPPTRAALDAAADASAGFAFPTNTLIASQTWLPAVSAPAGFSPEGAPIGLEFVGRPYRDAELLALVYGFEQATRWRRAPFLPSA